jgi:hypothetical protein
MARGYLGKISAVVAVNTDDARAKLSASAKDFTRYARSVQSTIGSATSSAGRSLDAIFTPLQRLQRALAATQNGSLGRSLNLGIDQAQVTRIQQFVSASELLQKPLAAGVTEFVKLSRTIQGEFQPALVRAQSQVEAVREEIARFGQVSEADFAAVEARVNRTTQAIERLTEASRLVQNASVPNSIRVTNPQQFDALTRAGNLQQRSAALSAQTASSFGLNAQQSQIEETSKRLARQIALRKRLNLEGKDTSGTDQAIAATTQKLTQQLGVQENLVDAAERYTKSLTQAASTTGPQQGPPLPPGFGDDSRFADFGLDLDDPRRQLEVLKGSVVSLKGQLDTLPAGIRSQFIPAIQQAETRLRALAANPRATADEIERARNEVDRLTRSARQAAQVSALPNFAEAFEGSALRGAIGNLQAFQQILARVGATAGSEAATLFDRMRQAIQRATVEGRVGTRAFARELEQLTNQAAEAAAATGRIGRGSALREIRRGGDIARGGFDNLSLAAQQAAFAIDDFFSVQGDFTQRIRAVQNNLTQLAFILGGTRGLFIGIAAAITAQAVVGLINWINNGRTAEDQTKALNDALARQKSLVEELVQAFESLGQTISQRAFSDSAQEARAFRRELDEIAQQQRELRDARVLNASPDIGVVRADQNRIERQLENETDGGRRVALQRQLQESRQSERRIQESLLSRPAPSGQDVRNALQDLIQQFGASAANRRAVGGALGAVTTQPLSAAGAATAALPANIQAILRGTNFGATPQALRSQVQALDDAIGSLSAIANERTFLGTNTFSSGAANEAVRLLTDLQAALRRSRVDKELDDAAERIFESGNLSSLRIQQAQNSVAEAIEAGIPGARAAERNLNRLGDQLEKAFTDLANSRSIDDPTERSRVQDGVQRRIDAIRRRQRDEVAAADALRRETTLFPEQSIQNVISRIESGLSNLGGAGGNAQAELRRLQFERESIRQQRTAIGDNPFAARRLDIADAGLIDAIRSLEREVAELDETFNGFEARERDRFRGDAERGRELSLTPAQRAGEQLQQGLNDILARFGEVAENENGLIDFQAAREAQLRFAEEQNRAAAPAIFSLADSVENAILQGPSRAALNVSDISTQEGARELNRLLRGEDPARDNANLQELQRQSQILEENNRILREKLVAA